MNIIHINTSLYNGGLENMMIDIANQQVSDGNEVTIIVINNNVDESVKTRIDERIILYTIKRTNGSYSVFPWLKLYFILRKINNAIIHCHAISLGRILRLFSNKKVIYTIHALNYETTKLKYYHSLYAISNSVKFDIQQRSKFQPVVIHNGIMTKLIRFKDYSSKHNSTIRIVQVGRLDSLKKGQDVLIRAAKSIILDSKGYDITIDFIGDGPSFEELKNSVRNLGLEDYIHFLGNKSRDWVYNNLANYDIFVQASRFEGFGLTVAEAMAAKLPVIVANNDGPSEIINNGEFGKVFQNGNSDDLEIKIIETIEMIKRGDIYNFVERSYRHCLNNFDIRKTVQLYYFEYSKLL
ncbi:MAG TPA: glycosyltransferase [Tenuifilaceae bacterium]|nr:glycosyltransferase [Tenuifilaceae bacterium]HPN22245.1 glycosyltransferase [Tenuifilaceae bacterium]